jgi:glycine zipper 2TM protein
MLGACTNKHLSSAGMLRNFVVFFMVVFAAAACSDQGKQATADSDLAHDIALANQAPANPTFNDTALGAAPETPPAATPARRPTRAAPRTPRTPAPRRVATEVVPSRVEPTPVEQPAPAPRTRGFRSGTSFGLTTKSPVCTTNLPGDKFTATLTEPVTGENGAYLPAGTTVVLEVAAVTPGDTPQSAQISLRVRSILLNDEPVSMEGDVAIASALERREIPRDKNADRRKVVGGAVAGAIIGQIMGKDTKSTVIGAAAGAAAGTAAAAASRKFDACLPAGGSLRVTTSQPITLGD